MLAAVVNGLARPGGREDLERLVKDDAGGAGSVGGTEPAPQAKRLSPERPQTTPDICRSRPPTSENDRAPTYTPEMPTSP